MYVHNNNQEFVAVPLIWPGRPNTSSLPPLTISLIMVDHLPYISFDA